MKRTWIGAPVRTPYNETGIVIDELHGLDAACEKGYLGPNSDYARIVGDEAPPGSAITRWLDNLEFVPKTPRSGKWYVVEIHGGGEAIYGELDLIRTDN